MESLTDQIGAFAATLIIGVVGGFCYDYYRAVRRTFRLKKVGTWLGDIIFWLVTTALVFFLLLLGNCGVVRYYVFFGLGLGAWLYFQFFSNIISRLVRFKFYLLQKIWTMIVIIILFLINVVLFPFRLVFLILSYVLNFLGGLFNKVGRKLSAGFNNLIMKRMRRGLATLKSMLSYLVFWKRKKDEK